MGNITYKVTLRFPERFIGGPYTEALNDYIDFTKKSGINRAKSEAGRRKCVEEYLKSVNQTFAWFEQLEKDSVKQFHFDAAGNIYLSGEANVIPCIVNANAVCRPASKICEIGHERSAVKATDFVTNRTKEDGNWARTVVVTSGAGAKLSNQRAMRRNDYIENFTATGTLTVNDQFVKPETLKKLLVLAGETVGMGSSRKMGHGRFIVDSFVEVKRT
jgi:hypothetical protein